LTSPEELVKVLLASGAPLMSYTYSEPIVWQDYMLATAKLVHKEGLLNCMVTNGSFSPVSLERVLPWIDAFNIDVKGDDAFYRDYCGGRLAPVMDSIGTITHTPKKVLEVTTLLIEGVHTRAMLAMIGKDLARLGVKVWHLSRFFPHYKMVDRPPSSERFLLEMLEVARGSGIPYIYAGNSVLSEWEQTCCPSCGTLLMASHSYAGEAGLDCAESVVDGNCQACGEPVYGLFSP
jgi:pyruvate formate lyase activating enzyme